MKESENFSYENPLYAPLREPARKVVEAYQNAARYLDTIQEWAYIDGAMKHTSHMLHDLAHEMPRRFDAFGDMLHERHLRVEYPATPELVEDVQDMDKVFEIATGVLDEIHQELEAFRAAADSATLRPMALKAEEQMAQNSKDYTMLLECWAMWDKEPNPASFDSWVHSSVRWGWGGNG